MKLIDLQSGKPLNIGDPVSEVVFGKNGTITSIHPPTSPEGVGVVGVKLQGRGYCFPYTPDEINTKFSDGEDVPAIG